MHHQHASTNTLRVARNWVAGAAVVTLCAAAFATGCGGGTSGVGSASPSSNQSAPLPVSVGFITQVPTNTPGSAALPTDWVMALLQSVSTPAEAASLASLPGALVNV